MELSKIEQQRLKDIAALAKVRSDAQAILHLLRRHRGHTGNDQYYNRYTTQIEERAQQIVNTANNTNQ